MNYNGHYKAYDITISTDELRGPRFRCDQVTGTKWYEKEADLVRAIDAYDLKARKNFTNGQAWFFNPRWGRVPSEVAVTTLDPDGRTAWVMKDGKREKVDIDYLFSDKEKLLEVIKARKELEDRAEALLEEVPKWKPEASCQNQTSKT